MRCPRCDSPSPHLHPAVQFEGEVQPCPDAFHRTVTPQNTPERIAASAALARAVESRLNLVAGRSFADEVLCPDRCTRSEGGRSFYDPLRDRDHLIPGDQVLVNVSAYNAEVEPMQWCDVVSLAPGDAAVFPYKVAIPERGAGQYAAGEIRAWRRPVALHRRLVEYAATSERMAAT